MPVKQVKVRRNLNTTEDTDRGPSNAVWGNCPIEELMSDPSRGIYFFDDFLSFPKTPATTEGNFGQYAQFSSTGGTITAGTGQYGEIAFGSDGDDEGASIRTRSTPFKIITTAKRFWFEARVKSSTVADTKHGFFLGLMEDAALTATVPIAADGTLADQNLVGFHRLEGDGDEIDTVYKANTVTAVTVQADALHTALAADTYVKLGMVYNHEADLLTGTKFVLTFFVNGVKCATQKTIPTAAGTDFPNDVGLGLVFAVLNATATTPGTSTLDWWGAAQLSY